MRAKDVWVWLWLSSYAISNVGMYALSLKKIPQLFNIDDIDEVNSAFFLGAFILVLPLLWASIRAGRKEQQDAEQVAHFSTYADSVGKAAVSVLKSMPAIAGVVILAKPLPMYARIFFGFFSALGSCTLYYFFFKRSDHIPTYSAQLRQLGVVRYLAFGFALGDCVLRYHTMLDLGTEFQKKPIQPGLDIENTVLFILITLEELAVLRQQAVSVSKRIFAFPSFQCSREMWLAHYCSSVKILSVAASFMLLPRQLSGEVISKNVSIAIGTTAAVGLLPGFYASIYSLFGNKKLGARSPQLTDAPNAGSGEDASLITAEVETPRTFTSLALKL